MRPGSYVGAAVLCLAARFAVAVEPDGGVKAATASAPILATIYASSERQVAGKKHGALQALDMDASTSWCAAPDDAHPELIITFPKPVALKSVEVFGGDEKYLPDLIELDAGDWNAELRFNEETGWMGPYKFPGIAGRMATRLVVRLPKGSARCLSELNVELRDQPWVYGLEPQAVDTVQEAITALTAALRSCDRHALTSLCRFPVTFRGREWGFAGSEYVYDHDPIERYASAKKLHCNFLVYPEGENNPTLVRSVAPGTVRVLGGAYTSGVYWNLAWIKGQWKLVGAESAIFE
jgi:hypothetical protein